MVSCSNSIFMDWYIKDVGHDFTFMSLFNVSYVDKTLTSTTLVTLLHGQFVLVRIIVYFHDINYQWSVRLRKHDIIFDKDVKFITFVSHLDNWTLMFFKYNLENKYSSALN